MKKNLKSIGIFLMLSTIFSFSLGDFYLNKNIVKAEGEKKVVNVDRIYKELNGYIDKKTTENLIYKVTNNITTEADLEKTEPLYTIHSKEYNVNVVKKIYKDGSFIKTGMKDGSLENLDYNLSMTPTNLSGSIMPTNLSGIHCGNGYCYATNGHAYKYVNGSELGFYASFEYGNGIYGRYGHINSVWSGYIKRGYGLSGPYKYGPSQGVYYASVSGFSNNGGHYIVTLVVGPGGAYVY